jgi:hypothetical protein
MTKPQRFKASYYNLRVVSGTTTLLFNGATGGLLRLDKAMARDLEPLLGPRRPRTAGTGYGAWNPPRFGRGDLPAGIKRRFKDFLDSGIFVAAECDERDDLRRAYAADRSNTPFLVTITTTLDCNMRCYYCYQKEGELESMSLDMSDAIATWTRAEIENHRHSICCVDWYGGEPMLNQAVINRYSENLIAFCDARGVEYRGSMICNHGVAGRFGGVCRTKQAAEHPVLDRRAAPASGQAARLDRRQRRQRPHRIVRNRDAHHRSADRANQDISSHHVDPWIGRDCLVVIDGVLLAGGSTRIRNSTPIWLSSTR